MELLPVLRPGCLPTPSGLGGTGGPAHLTSLPFGMEASPPLEDQSFRLAPRTTTPITRALQQRVALNSPVECPLCAGAVEDCSHLFFVYPLAQAVWQAVNVGRIVVSSEKAF